MHMRFLSRGFKNLQWYGMTRRSRFVCLLRLIFYIAEREMVLSSPSFLSGAGREKARQLPRFFLFLPARSFLKEGPPRCQVNLVYHEYARLSILFRRRIQHLPLFFMHIALSGGKTTVAIPNKGICPTT